MYIDKIVPELRSIVNDSSEGFGHHPSDNAYGTLVFQEKSGKKLPVMCGCGGSMWLCPKCKEVCLAEQASKERNRDEMF